MACDQSNWEIWRHCWTDFEKKGENHFCVILGTGSVHILSFTLNPCTRSEGTNEPLLWKKSEKVEYRATLGPVSPNLGWTGLFPENGLDQFWTNIGTIRCTITKKCKGKFWKKISKRSIFRPFRSIFLWTNSGQTGFFPKNWAPLVLSVYGP